MTKNLLDNPVVLLLEYWPSHTGGYSSETYAEVKVAEWAKRLKESGIECNQIHTHMRMKHPIGSGAGGRVRCGDDWIPTRYSIVVKPKDLEAARHIIAQDPLADQMLRNNSVVTITVVT